MMESVLTQQKKNLKPCPESVDHYKHYALMFVSFCVVGVARYESLIEYVILEFNVLYLVHVYLAV